MREKVAPAVLLGVMLVSSTFLAIIFSLPFQIVGYNTAFENPESPTNPLIYIFFMVGISALLLFAFRSGRGGGVGYLLYVGFGLILLYVLYPFFALALYYIGIRGTAVANVGFLCALIFSGFLMALNAVYRDWRLNDAVGVLIAGGGAALLGINFAILPSFVFLSGLAIYDFIAVYVTKHMLTLADGVLGISAPMLVAVPRHGGRRRKKDGEIFRRGAIRKKVEGKEEPSAMYMGLGDMVVPGVLAASSIAFLPLHPVIGVWGPRLVALGVLAGISVAYVYLARMVLRGRPQAGLPFLNTGAVLGYVFMYLSLYRDLSLGM